MSARRMPDRPMPAHVRPAAERILAAVAEGVPLYVAAAREGYATCGTTGTSLHYWHRWPEWRRDLAAAVAVADRRWRPVFLDSLRGGATIHRAAKAAGIGADRVYRARRENAGFAAQMDAAIARHARGGRACPDHEFEAVLIRVRQGVPLAVACREIGRATFDLRAWRAASPGSRSHRRAALIDEARARGERREGRAA